MKQAITAILTSFLLWVGAPSKAEKTVEIKYASLPVRAETYGPVLTQEINTFWPQMTCPSVLWALVEQETCITLKHKSCWSPTAQLKTAREQGYGLGQITRAWNADGSLRFDSLAEVKKHHNQVLSEWSWKNVANAKFQLRALVLMNKDLYDTFDFAETEIDRYAFTDAAYNGGRAGVLSDRALCQKSQNCNPNIWRGHVEKHSKKAKTTVNGYGKGFFYINREHVENVVYGFRRARYIDAGVK